MRKGLVGLVIVLVLVAGSVGQASGPCPVGMELLARCEVDRWASAAPGDFEACFESGGDQIDIGLVGYNLDEEPWYIGWFVQPGSGAQVSAALVKAGQDGSQEYLYDPPKVEQWPPEEILVRSVGKVGISHVVWCTPGPTQVGLVSATATQSAPGWALGVALVGVLCAGWAIRRGRS